MVITSIIVRKDIVVVKFDNDTKLRLSYDLYTNYYLYVGKEIDKPLYKELKYKSLYDESFQYAKKYVMTHHISFFKFKKKLEGKGIPYYHIKKILQDVQSLGYLNDEEYCEYVINRENRKHNGKNHIINLLYKDGISYSLISKFMFDDDNEKRKIFILITRYKKRNTKGDCTLALYTYLLRKGFDEDLIKECLNIGPIYN